MRFLLRVLMIAAASVLLLLSACSADTLVVLDPILAAALDRDGSFSRDIVRAGRSIDRQVRVVVLRDASTAALDEVLSVHAAELVMLPGLLAAPAAELSPVYPSRSFYLVGFEAPLPGISVYPVSFDRVDAFAAAGKAAARRLADASTGGAAAQLTVLFTVDSPRRAAELAAFRQPVEAQTDLPATGDSGSRLVVHEFSTRPEREALQRALDNRSRGGIYAFFVGSANPQVWELLGDRRVGIITESLPPQIADRRVIGWIESSWADALRSVVVSDRSAVHGPVRVPARFVERSFGDAVNSIATPADD